ncbi:hypothetical protein AXG93_1923s1680 [Marchantia polymorpha subsp. ruderalis]|uniref:Uncharacterized protein n=1 Tax=Marchantia polymorpha subsp. ruderalis TaxID=1480154 RepID=A0A176VE66_MARPO|nr:hypothetical protein AXG93_1923s1680 [Marchantia polymorpha subsp. ruderalis]
MVELRERGMRGKEIKGAQGSGKERLKFASSARQPSLAQPSDWGCLPAFAQTQGLLSLLPFLISLKFTLLGGSRIRQQIRPCQALGLPFVCSVALLDREDLLHLFIDVHNSSSSSSSSRVQGPGSGLAMDDVPAGLSVCLSSLVACWVAAAAAAGCLCLDSHDIPWGISQACTTDMLLLGGGTGRDGSEEREKRETISISCRSKTGAGDWHDVSCSSRRCLTTIEHLMLELLLLLLAGGEWGWGLDWTALMQGLPLQGPEGEGGVVLKSATRRSRQQSFIRVVEVEDYYSAETSFTRRSSPRELETKRFDCRRAWDGV